MLEYTLQDIKNVQPFADTAVRTHQIEQRALSGMFRTLKLALKAPEELLTIKATCLALKCSRPTIYVMIEQKKLKTVKLTNKAVRILKSSLNDLLLGRVDHV